MRMRSLWAAVMLIGGIAAGWALLTRSPHRSVSPASVLSSAPPSDPVAILHAPYDPTAVQKTLTFYASRVRDNPQGAIEYGLLAGTYLQRCRETGDIADATRAEQAARRSLAIRSRNNAAAVNQLALSLFTQHRFTEALLLAEQTARSPEDQQAGYLRAECLLEIGDYDKAEQALRAVEGDNDNPTANTLRARLNSINGNSQAALALYVRAQHQADSMADIPVANIAWFHMRRGDCLAGMGRAKEAEQAYQEALALFPTDYRTLTALCRLAAGQNDWPQAIAWGRKSAAIVPTPEILALLYDVYQAKGDRGEAQRQSRLLETVARLSRVQGVVYDRQRALFYADHASDYPRSLPEALRLAQREMRVRHDIYAYDTLAWACFANGKLPEAQTTMRQALAHHTQDAMLFYHAGRIALAQHEPAQGKAFLQQALAVNPFFHPTAPTQVRAILARPGD